MYNQHARNFRNIGHSAPMRQTIDTNASAMFLICESGSRAYITSNAKEIAQLRTHYGRDFHEIAVPITHNQHGYSTTHFAGKRFETPALLLKAWCGLR